MAQTGVCYIVGGGAFDIDRFRPEKDDCIIAADSGLVYIEEAGYHPNWIVGDFDSLGYRPKGNNVICHPAEKDDTDVSLAAKLAVKEGYGRIYFFGVSGGRLDHTLANLQMITDLCKKGLEVFCFCPDCTITALSNGTMIFTKDYWGTISFFAAGDAAGGVCLDGFKYPLENATLTNSRALGVSNEFMGCEAKVSVTDGVLWIIWQENESCELPVLLS